ncbi:nucleotidyl transferase AbiEii/AbiGii toxin family protein [Streptomyces sp. NPDC005279]|uniref:nucleotidyl transferase AbiEii/AbiGii toxin family protein n=1 Tax=Streptomyces sp. NPDC005279 TaxID=3364712 RepID=UPI0036918870
MLTGPLVGLWGTLLDLSEKVTESWTLIGGQMVLMHGLEHDRTPPAASLDLDVLADVVSQQQSLRLLVAALEELGFRSAGVSPQGKAHRYKRDGDVGELVVDLLAPDNLGKRADLTTTPPGVTLEVPGGRQAMQRSESVGVQLGERRGVIRRPSLLGAIVGKAAALGIPTAPKAKHYRDLAFLLSLPANPLVLKSELTKGDRRKLALAGALEDPNHAAWTELRDSEAQADGRAMYRFLSS